MIRNYRWIGAALVASTLALAGGSAQAQFYRGGYWGGGYGGAQTVQGSELQGAGLAAMGMGRYNVDTAQARSINAQTAMQWNQYMYQSDVQAREIYYERMQKQMAREKGDIRAIKDRLRNNPNADDIANGNALNIAWEDLSNPMVFQKSVYYGGKTKIGGTAIRNIPFQYASAAITTSVHQLVQGQAPAALKSDEFGPYRDQLKAIVAELRKEGEELGSPKPETIKKAKDQIMATKAKVEATFPQASQERRDAETYIKSLYGLASMLETPAINVLLAGVENRPEATVGDLLGFMSAYNLRFGATQNNDQLQVYKMLYPTLVRLRADVAGDTGPAPAAPAQAANTTAPGAVFNSLDYNHAEKPIPPPPAPR